MLAYIMAAVECSVVLWEAEKQSSVQLSLCWLLEESCNDSQPT